MNLRQAWCRETAHPSYQADWSEDNPAYGQCAVTALVMQEIIGGKIYECTICKKKHFYNVAPDGQKYDFTQEQFNGLIVTPSRMRERTRESLLKVENVKNRYELLKSRIFEN